MNVKSHDRVAKFNQRQPRRFTRRGYTLLELVISAGAATVLLGGLMSTIVVANRAWSPDLKPAIKTEAGGLTRQLSIDLKSALYFTERTSTAVTFAVPDRDGDGQPELLRYAWSGTSGDPLTVSLNGGTAQVIVADVQTFNLDFILRSVIAPVIPASGKNESIVFISEAAAEKGGFVSRESLAEEDQSRIATIESWGFTVSSVSGYAADSDWELAVENAAAIYVPGSVSDTQIFARLTSVTTGVVFEQAILSTGSGYASDLSVSNGTSIDLENVNHYITSELPSGMTEILSATRSLVTLTPSLGPDVQTLARGQYYEYEAALAVIETGGRTLTTGSTPGRRVLLPWGKSSTDFTLLTEAALSIMERSIVWAAGQDQGTARKRILYLVHDERLLFAQDFDRRMLFESAGYEVRVLSQTRGDEVLSREIAECSAIYLAVGTQPDTLLHLLYDASQGVICGGIDWAVPLGFGTLQDNVAVGSLEVADEAHPIMNGISSDPVTVLNSNSFGTVPAGELAKGISTILQTSSKGKGSAAPAVVTLERDALRVDETGTPGRRTIVPFHNARRADFTANGYQLMKQAMDWTTLQPVEALKVEADSGGDAFESFLRSLSL